MADLKYSEDALQERLKLARETERYKVWCDVFSVFTTPVRQHFAHLMAHGYRVVAVELQHPDGRCDFKALTIAASGEAMVALEKTGARSVADPISSHPLVHYDRTCPGCNTEGVQPCAETEPCWCDKQGIGQPGVSCGDCPTRDYKQANAGVREDGNG